MNHEYCKHMSAYRKVGPKSPTTLQSTQQICTSVYCKLGAVECYSYGVKNSYYVSMNYTQDKSMRHRDLYTLFSCILLVYPWNHFQSIKLNSIIRIIKREILLTDKRILICMFVKINVPVHVCYHLYIYM